MPAFAGMTGDEQEKLRGLGLCPRSGMRERRPCHTRECGYPVADGERWRRQSGCPLSRGMTGDEQEKLRGLGFCPRSGMRERRPCHTRECGYPVGAVGGGIWMPAFAAVTEVQTGAAALVRARRR